MQCRHHAILSPGTYCDVPGKTGQDDTRLSYTYTNNHTDTDANTDLYCANQDPNLNPDPNPDPNPNRNPDAMIYSTVLTM